MRLRGACTSLCIAAGVLVCVGGSPDRAHAQNVRGVVTDDGTRLPVALATVVAIAASGDVAASMLTDSTGFFTLDLPSSGRYVVRATALGYSASRQGPIDFETDGARVLYFDLTPRAIELEGLTVETIAVPGRLPVLIENGFADRMREGRGQFLTPDAIARSNAFFTPELFESLDYVIPQYGTAPWLRFVSIISTGKGDCTPRLFVDGTWMRREMIADSTGLDDLVPLDELLAAELYRGPFQAPMKYQGTTYDNACGVLLLWTKSGARVP